MWIPSKKIEQLHKKIQDESNHDYILKANARLFDNRISLCRPYTSHFIRIHIGLLCLTHS